MFFACGFRFWLMRFFLTSLAKSGKIFASRRKKKDVEKAFLFAFSLISLPEAEGEIFISRSFESTV